MKPKQSGWIGGLFIAGAAGLLMAVFFATKPQTSVGEKEITVEVIHSDKTKKETVLQSDAAFLEEALLDASLVEGSQSQYGLYIETVDGETARYDQKKAWWKLLVNGEPASRGAAEVPVEDGAVYTLEYVQD